MKSPADLRPHPELPPLGGDRRVGCQGGDRLGRRFDRRVVEHPEELPPKAPRVPLTGRGQPPQVGVPLFEDERLAPGGERVP